jgi:hypothetical protein
VTWGRQHGPFARNDFSPLQRGASREHPHSPWTARWYFGRSNLSVANCLSNADTHKYTPHKQQTTWPESASELYRPSNRRLSTILVPTFADRGSSVFSATDPHGLILGFLDQSSYYFFQVAHQLYSRGSVDRVQDPLLLRKSGSAGNRTRTSGSVARNCDRQQRLSLLL